MIQTYQTHWHDQNAWAMESDHLRLITVPEMGAKIVSIYHKTAGHEWLLGPADRAFQPVAYGASFIDQDMSGWDEMFPTIIACAYPGEGPYAGAALPDHGEVWALPWEVTQADAAQLVMQVSGRALPYRLARALIWPNDHTLQMNYVVTNTGTAPLAGLWAAHPQFTATSSTEIRLPSEVQTVTAVQPLGDWAAAGTRLPWPLVTPPDGQPLRLDRVTTAAARQSRKVYTLPDQNLSWAMLYETGADCWLRLDWNAAHIPYLGIWVDEGQYNPELAIALEPSNGYYDSLVWAWENKRVPVVEPGETLAWSLILSVGSAAKM